MDLKLINNLKSNYETTEIFSKESFIYSDIFADRFLGFYLSEGIKSECFIIAIDTDEISKDLFESVSKADIIVKQKECISNEQAYDFFERKFNKLSEEASGIEKKNEKDLKEIMDFDDKDNEALLEFSPLYIFGTEINDDEDDDQYVK